MAPHFSTLAWKIPWMEEPGGLQSMGSLRVGHDWATSLSLSWIGEGNGNPLQCSCLENPRDGGAWWAAIYGVTQSQTRLKRLSSSSSSSSNMLLTGLSTSTLISAFGLFIRQQLERPFHNVKSGLITLLTSDFQAHWVAARVFVVAAKPIFLFLTFQPWLLPLPPPCLFYFSHTSFVGVLRRATSGVLHTESLLPGMLFSWLSHGSLLHFVQVTTLLLQPSEKPPWLRVKEHHISPSFVFLSFFVSHLILLDYKF